jgi:hypothetical protein
MFHKRGENASGVRSLNSTTTYFYPGHPTDAIPVGVSLWF